MKTLEEIFESGRKLEDVIADLKYYKDKVMTLQSWSDIEKEYEPKNHKIMTDKVTYPDKKIHDDDGNLVRFEPVTRIAVGLQKLSVKRMAEFMFTVPVQSVAEDTDDQLLKDQFTAVKKVQKKNKWNALNKKRCKIISSECECATLWYVVKADHKTYGFDSKYKLRHTILSPANGDTLYPTFDDTGDLIVFSREFKVLDGDNKKTVFEIWTADKHIVLKQTDNKWEEITTEEITIGKIPVIYGYRKTPIWQDADSGKVHEIELLLSRNGDTIAYHSAPVLILKGDLQGAPTKGESNKVFISKNGEGDGKYVSWTQAPEAVKFQFDTLLRLFFHHQS